MVEPELNIKDMLAGEWEYHSMLKENCDWETTNSSEDRCFKGPSITGTFSFEIISLLNYFETLVK